MLYEVITHLSYAAHLALDPGEPAVERALELVGPLRLLARAPLGPVIATVHEPLLKHD